MKNITLTDVRNEAFEAIQKLKRKEMDIQTAKEINNLLDTITNTAKAEVEFIKAIPESIKKEMTKDNIEVISGTFINKDIELDVTLKEIDSRRKNYVINPEKE